MLTITFKSLKDGFTFQREGERKRRYGNSSGEWQNDPVTGEISFVPARGQQQTFNTNTNIIIVETVTLTGTHQEKLAYIEANVNFRIGIGPGGGPVPDLQQVTNVGNTTTYLINAAGYQFTDGGVQVKASLWVIVATYAEMIAAATGIAYKRIKVLNDENKGMINTTYDYWPGVGTDWVAVTQEL